MGKYVVHRKERNDSGYGSRSERRAGNYESYQPDLLSAIRFVPEPATITSIEDASYTVGSVDAEIRNSKTTGMMSILSKSESIASSMLEDVEGSTHNIVIASSALPGGSFSASVRSIVKNISATDDAIRRFSEGDISVEDIVSLQSELIQYEENGYIRNSGLTGIRFEQNRIGGKTLLDAEYIPPSPDTVGMYMDDLVSYINNHDDSPLITAAFAHAQFESIHPFIDGNGRTGRAIIQGMLRRDGVTTKTVFPVSAVLAKRSSDYIAGLDSFRVDGEPNQELLNEWVRLFADSLESAALIAQSATRKLVDFRDEWQSHNSSMRSDSIAHNVVEYIMENMVATPEVIAENFGVSDQAARNALSRFEDDGFLNRKKHGRSHVYYSPVMMSILDDIDRPDSSIASNQVSVLPIPSQRSNTNANRCGFWMPRARRNCERTQGHSGEHK